MRDQLVAWLDQFLPSGVAATIAPTWFMCVGLAGLVTLGLMCVIARRRGIDTGVIASIVVWAYLAAVIAGIVVPATIECIGTLVTTGRFQVRWAGMTSFWGYLAAFIAMAIACRRHELSLARFGDLAAAPLGLALVFARLGCFVGGCDYGKVTSVPWAMRFPAGSPAWRDHVRAGLLPADRAESLPVHPTQLYEAMLGLVIVGVALVVSRTKWGREGRGRIVLACAATYALGRIGIETLRGDLGRGIYAGLSSGQIFSIGVLVAIAAGMLFAHRRRAMLVATAATAMLMLVTLGEVGDAHAQAPQPTEEPAPPSDPQPQPSDPQSPYPQPQPYPQPYGPPQPYGQPEPYPRQPYPYPPEQPQPARPAQPATAATSHVQLGVLIGLATAMNRRADQVPALGGPTLSLGWIGSHAGLWLDFDSLGNSDASHGTLLVSGSMGTHVGEKLFFGGRVGVGRTLVNFDDDAFMDVSGTTFRFEAIAEYAISRSWMAWVRPMSFDILTASELGGPITTYQVRAGIAYRFGIGAKPARAAMQPRAYPAYAPLPQPYRYPPPQEPMPQPQPSPIPQPTEPALPAPRTP